MGGNRLAEVLASPLDQMGVKVLEVMLGPSQFEVVVKGWSHHRRSILLVI